MSSTVKIKALKDPKGAQHMKEGQIYEVSKADAEVLIKTKRAEKVK